MADSELNDADFELLLQFVDGELTGTEQARAQTLVADHADARAFVQDWSTAKVALRQAVLEAPTEVDLSRIRGRVMTKLPAETRQAIAATTQEPNSFWKMLQKLGLGKVSFAVGAAAAAAVWLVATSTGPLLPNEDPGAVAQRHGTAGLLQPGAEPEVIIEDTLEEGSLMVQHGEHTGDATIIWHYKPVANGQGEG